VWSFLETGAVPLAACDFVEKQKSNSGILNWKLPELSPS